MSDAPPFSPTRTADLYKQFAGLLHVRFSRRFPTVDPHRVADAVVEAILALAASPAAVTYRQLYQKTRERLRSFFRSETRRLKRENRPADVTKSAAAVPSLLEELADRELATRYRDRIAKTDHERAALAHWLDGYTSPVELATRIAATVEETTRLLARFRRRIARERVEYGSETGA
jgi:aminopeptidase N